MAGSTAASERTGAPTPGLTGQPVKLSSGSAEGAGADAAAFRARGRRPARSGFRAIGLPLLLLAASVITITSNGARFMQNFREGMPPVVRDADLWPWPWLAVNPGLFKTGFKFSMTLLGILLVHEFGHYFACRWHGIRASLPWVIPAPTLSGTAGAVIRIRSPFRSRIALMDVGIFGPLCGYVAAVSAVVVGFLLSRPAMAGAPGALVRFGGDPLTLRLIHAVLVRWRPAIPDFKSIAPHPVLIAGWIGLFITSLNLIPGGQLDGGHILYAVSPRLHKIFTRLLPVALFIAGAVWWVGWILWGAILLIPAMRHPAVPAYPPLNRRGVVLAAIGLIILLLTFTPEPFYGNSLMNLFRDETVRMGP